MFVISNAFMSLARGSVITRRAAITSRKPPPPKPTPPPRTSSTSLVLAPVPDYHRSSGVRPVLREIRESMRGPISSLSWKEKTKSW